MIYREYPAGPALASVVDRVWTLEGHAREMADAQPVLPDGRPEIILHLGDSFERVNGDAAPQRQGSVVFAGQLLRPLDLRATGRVGVVGIRLTPHGAAALLCEPQNRLVGLTANLDGLSSPLSKELDGARVRARDIADAARIAREVVARRVDPRRLDRRVHAAVDLIRHARGLVTMDALAARVGVTSRHLERQFKQAVGISPKRLARITRFQRALRMFERLDSAQRGTHTAAACGYADQAHFIRDFVEFAGCAPGEHLLRQAELNGFFSSRPRPIVEEPPLRPVSRRR
jgi:AraC-like DNA-binding protein